MKLAEQNAEIVRRAYEAFNTADGATLAKLMSENITWHTPGTSSLAGDHKGSEATFAQFGRYGGDTQGTFRATLLDVLHSDSGAVVGIHHNTGERNGKLLDVYCCIVFELENGQITDGREHFYDLNAWDAFWA